MIKKYFLKKWYHFVAKYILTDTVLLAIKDGFKYPWEEIGSSSYEVYKDKPEVDVFLVASCSKIAMLF